MTLPLLGLLIGWLSTPAQAKGDSPAELATARLYSQKPHTAHYVKDSTGEPALSISVRAPQDVTLKVFSSDGQIAMSINPTHFRVQVNSDCATVPTGPIFAAMQEAGLRSEADPSLPQIDYRLSRDGLVNLNVLFSSAPQASPLLWLADLSAEGTTLSGRGRYWNAERDGVQWSVDLKTGLLQRMSAGEHAIHLDRVTPAGASVTVPTAADLCAEGASNPALARQFERQFLLQLVRIGLPQALTSWESAAESARFLAVQQQKSLWLRYFAADLPDRLAILEDAAWRAQALAQIADRAAFEQFTQALPPDQQSQAVMRWQSHWYTDIGSRLISQAAQDAEAELIQLLSADGVMVNDPAILSALLSSPLQSAGIATAEVILRPPLSSLIEEGSAFLPGSRAP